MILLAVDTFTIPVIIQAWYNVLVSVANGSMTSQSLAV